MYRFSVQKMCCSRYVSAITRAIQSTDSRATVRADLKRREVAITSLASKAGLLSALRQAGLPAQTLALHMG